jgi:hypothetical protein
LQLPVVVTDAQPGFVDTAMAKAAQKFRVATPEQAATQIFAAVQPNEWLSPQFERTESTTLLDAERGKPGQRRNAVRGEPLRLATRTVKVRAAWV